MRLHCALFPPEEALVELADAVRAVAPGTPELEPVPVAEMQIPVTRFGNVTQSDARALGAMLRREAAGWAPPKLYFAGATALEWRGDESVWARLDGDVDGLLALGRGVSSVVRRLGFLVDRRQFRPLLAVGTITDHTTAPYLERLVAALEAFAGQPWRLEHLVVLRRLPVLDDGSDGGSEVVERLPLGDG